MKQLTQKQIENARISLNERMIQDKITLEEYDYICYLEQYVLKLKDEKEQLGELLKHHKDEIDSLIKIVRDLTNYNKG